MCGLNLGRGCGHRGVRDQESDLFSSIDGVQDFESKREGYSGPALEALQQNERPSGPVMWLCCPLIQRIQLQKTQ